MLSGFCVADRFVAEDARDAWQQAAVRVLIGT
jgi:hypothetical protein